MREQPPGTDTWVQVTCHQYGSVVHIVSSPHRARAGTKPAHLKEYGVSLRMPTALNHQQLLLLIGKFVAYQAKAGRLHVHLPAAVMWTESEGALFRRLPPGGDMGGEEATYTLTEQGERALATQEGTSDQEGVKPRRRAPRALKRGADTELPMDPLFP